MTAVQQYWIVESEVYLVSEIYPIVVRDDGVISSGVPEAQLVGSGEVDIFGTSAAEAMALELVIEAIVSEWANGFDTADQCVIPAPAIQSLLIENLSNEREYDPPFDPADAWKMNTPSALSLTVVTTRILYQPPFDTSNALATNAPSAQTLTVT